MNFSPRIDHRARRAVEIDVDSRMPRPRWPRVTVAIVRRIITAIGPSRRPPRGGRKGGIIAGQRCHAHSANCQQMSYGCTAGQGLLRRHVDGLHGFSPLSYSCVPSGPRGAASKLSHAEPAALIAGQSLPVFCVTGSSGPSLRRYASIASKSLLIQKRYPPTWTPLSSLRFGDTNRLATAGRAAAGLLLLTRDVREGPHER